MFCQLGDIKFDALNTPKSWSETHAVKYGEIPHVGAKPSLQKTGEELVSIELSITLSTDFCEPAQSLDALKIAQSQGEILPLVTGAGVMVGRFIINALNMTVNKMTATGELQSCDLNLSIKEYAPPPGSEKSQVKGEAIAGLTNRIREQAGSPVSTDAMQITTDLSKARSEVNSAKNVLNQVRSGTKQLKRGVRDVKSMANDAKLFYGDAKSKLLLTKKIIKRASQLPTSIDEAIAYADNLAKIDDLASFSTLEIRTNELSASADKVARVAAPVVSFVASKESGN